MDATIDFVAFDAEQDAWLLVLVEPGPWIEAAVKDRLTGLQDRLYGCLEAALEGQVAERSPDAVDKRVIVRVDCYDCYGTARDEVDAFIHAALLCWGPRHAGLLAILITVGSLI
jgi:hypothetical protein